MKKFVLALIFVLGANALLIAPAEAQVGLPEAWTAHDILLAANLGVMTLATLVLIFKPDGNARAQKAMLAESRSANQALLAEFQKLAARLAPEMPDEEDDSLEAQVARAQRAQNALATSAAKVREAEVSASARATEAEAAAATERERNAGLVTAADDANALATQKETERKAAEERAQIAETARRELGEKVVQLRNRNGQLTEFLRTLTDKEADTAAYVASVRASLNENIAA